MTTREWSLIERGHRDPKIATYISMEHALGREIMVPLAFDVPCDSRDPDRRTYVAIAASIRQKRKEHGWSIREAARRSLVAPDTWWRTETAQHNPFLSTVVRMALTVGVGIVVY